MTAGDPHGGATARPSPSARTEAFRAGYRARVPADYNGSRHLRRSTAVCLAMAIVAVVCIRDLRAWELWVLPAGFVFANAVEYLGHRNLLHARVAPLTFLYQRHTREHHRFFTEERPFVDEPRDYHIVLFPPSVPLFFLGGIAAPAGLLVGWLVSRNAGLLFAALAAAYYVLYEWLHLRAHLPPGRDEPRWGERLRAHHLRHHDPRVMRAGNFNITVPVWDVILGTVMAPRLETTDRPGGAPQACDEDVERAGDDGASNADEGP